MSSDSYSLWIDGELERLQAEFAQAPDKVSKAVHRAMRKLSTYAERQVLRALSRTHPITQKQLKKLRRLRVKLYTPSYGPSGNVVVNAYMLSIFVGTNEIAAHYYGKPQRVVKGVKTGRIFWQGAFIVPRLTGDGAQVFKRKKEWRHRYVRSRRQGRMMWMGLPIKLEKNSFHDDAVRALKDIEPSLEQRYITLVQQELHYAFHIES